MISCFERLDASRASTLALLQTTPVLLTSRGNRKRTAHPLDACANVLHVHFGPVSVSEDSAPACHGRATQIAPSGHHFLT